MDFIGNFILILVIKNFENRLRIEEVTAMSLVAAVFWDTV